MALFDENTADLFPVVFITRTSWDLELFEEKTIVNDSGYKVFLPY